MPDLPGSDKPSRPPDRRSFFRQVFLRSLDRVEKAGSEAIRRMGLADDAFATEPHTAHPHRATPGTGLRYLRPPGAIMHDAFEDACSRCGKCVEACPAQCIRIDPDVADGYPHIIARQSPCVVCTELACMNVCPTGALQKLTDSTHILMGTARVDIDTCLRHPDRGEDCTLCVIHCPEGERAIRVGDDNHIDVLEGCIGCGVCERVCPTEPASIIIEPVY